MDTEGEILKGKIDSYDEETGMGYIETEDGDLYYLHESEFIGDDDNLKPGDQVEFVEEIDSDDLIALDVKKVTSSS